MEALLVVGDGRLSEDLLGTEKVESPRIRFSGKRLRYRRKIDEVDKR